MEVRAKDELRFPVLLFQTRVYFMLHSFLEHKSVLLWEIFFLGIGSGEQEAGFRKPQRMIPISGSQPSRLMEQCKGLRMGEIHFNAMA